MRRKTRRQRGGAEYTINLTVPSSGTAYTKPADFPADLGTFSGNITPGFTFTNPTKSITDIRIYKGDGTELNTVPSYGTDVQTKIKMQVGATKSLVPSSIPTTVVGTAPAVRGATKMGAPLKGPVTVNNLNNANLNLVAGSSPNFTIKVTTSD